MKTREVKYFYNTEGQYHRDDGPAVEWFSGSKEWWHNGKLHRIGGPAIDFKNGLREWWVCGMRHRLDGPAVIYPESSKRWWIKHKRYSKKEHGRLVLFFALEPRRIDINPR